MLIPEEKLIKVSILAAILLLALIGYFIYVFVKQHRNISRWQEARIVAEIEILEQERARIALDLHDDIGVSLSAIKMQVAFLEPITEEEQVQKKKAIREMDETIQRFREIAYNLLPNTLVRKGFNAAVVEFIDKMDSQAIQINFNTLQFKLSPKDEINLFRVIQEIIHNTIKHSRATVLDIGIKNESNELFVTTQDNGIGFEYDETNMHLNGIGLLSIQSRVAILNGKLTVNTSIGKGAAFIIEIPLNNGYNSKK
jgi:signal transduction histidine kinase